MDPVIHEGLSAAEAARAMTVPKGFTVKVAAAEPDIVRPIAFTLDDRGRLWVAEAHTYPVRAEHKGSDRTSSSKTPRRYAGSAGRCLG
jgi:hypothetical protein